jgi:hypothetical protein
MCEFCGCAGRSTRNRTIEQTTSERKPVDVRIVAVTPTAESRTDALDRREEGRPAETAA